MSGYDKNQGLEDRDCATVDKRADVLQATFQHYYAMAMDHHTKAATTSNILLIAVGAILGFVTIDKQIAGIVDIVSGLAVFFLGVFGIIWALKQHERYHYWEHIAYSYQTELRKIVPPLQDVENYKPGAKKRSTSIFGRFIANLEDRYLWVFLHAFVVLMGIGIMAIAIYNRAS